MRGMMKKWGIFWVLSLFLIFLSGCEAAWKPETMDKQAWLNVIQKLMDDPVYGTLYKAQLLGKAEACLKVPYVAADRTSRDKFHFLWYVDVDKRKYREPRLAKQLKQLDMLVQAGLLERHDIAYEKEAQTIDAFRYTLSQKGWEMTSEVRAPFCFEYADFTFDDVISSQQRAVSSAAGLEMYSLGLKFKAIPRKDRFSWVEDRAMQDAFPEMARKLYDGEKANVTMIRGANGWIDYDAAIRGGMWLDNLALRVMKYQTAPTEAAVKKRIKERYVHKAGATPAEYKAYVDLPGTSEFPVDRVDNTLMTFEQQRLEDEHYRVYVFDNVERNKRIDHKVKFETLPWLNELVHAGMFTKKVFSDGKTGERGHVYELNRAYMPFLNKRYLGFDLGDPKIVFDDIRIGHGKGRHKVLSKFRLLFPDPPAWYDAKQFGNDTKIGRMVRQGMVCYSEDDYGGSGGGSCTWGFPKEFF